MSLSIHLAVLLILWFLWWRHPMRITTPPATSKQPITLDLKQFAPHPKPTATHKSASDVTPTLSKPQSKQTTPLHSKPPAPTPEVTKVAKADTKPISQSRPIAENETPIKKKRTVPAVRKSNPPKPKKIRKSVQPPRKPHTYIARKHSSKGLKGRLLRSATPIRPVHVRTTKADVQRMIRTLYGKEYYSFTKTQRRFIEMHLSEIRRITQNTLVRNGYPDVAVRTRQQGTNVVSFYLHPNGDITHLRLIRPMGYEALDSNTLEVIRIAYKDYPRPKQTTKIIFYVTYRLE